MNVGSISPGNGVGKKIVMKHNILRNDSLFTYQSLLERKQGYVHTCSPGTIIMRCCLLLIITIHYRTHLITS